MKHVCLSHLRVCPRMHQSLPLSSYQSEKRAEPKILLQPHGKGDNGRVLMDPLLHNRVIL